MLSKRLIAVVENASVGKPVTQSGTVYEDRIADNAVDGNISTTDPSMCTSAFYHNNVYRRLPAWLQVDLEDFYLVKAVTVYFPTVELGRYMYSTSTFIKPAGQTCRLGYIFYLPFIFLARSSFLPEGLYILLALISFFFKDCSKKNYLRIRWTDFCNFCTK